MLLRDLVVILAAALVVVLVLRRLRLPAVAGFIVAGALLGPAGLSWVRDVHQIDRLAEIGVVLLLFTVGLEFPLGELRRLGRILVVGGSLQVGLTTAATAGAAMALGLGAPKGVFLGFLVALSSTAIVLKELAGRGELEAPHGKLIVGMLLLQDLCVVPMILVVPALAGQGGGAGALLRALATAVVVVAAALTLARWVVPRALHLVAASRGRDLFVLAVALVGAAIAWFTSLAGLSLALGAFLAGVVLADSDYGHQAMADTLPVRDLFTSLFFVSMGMLLDLRVVVEHAWLLLAIVAAVMAGKALIAAFAGLVLRFPVRVALLAGLGVAQVGEFSFVLARQGAGVGLLDAGELRLFFAASVITMLATPLMLRIGPRLAEVGASQFEGLDRLAGRDVSPAAAGAGALAGHVVILGYGVGGQLLTEVLREAGIPLIALDLNARRVRHARTLGVPIHYGDVTRREILEWAGIARARQVVVVLSDPTATVRAVKLARELAPGVVILARARYVTEVPTLLAAGADEAVAQELEASFAVIERVTREARAPRPDRAAMRVRLGLEAPPEADASQARLPAGLEVESAVVPEGAWIAGRSLAEANLRRRTGATLVALTRGSDTAVHPSADDVLRAGDVLTIVGDAQQLAAARALCGPGPVDHA